MTFWVWNVECWMRNIHICYFATNAPATPPQLLQERPTFRNFAIVKQKQKITLSTGKFFFLDRKKWRMWKVECWMIAQAQWRMWKVECWMVGGADEEWGMKSEVIHQSIIQQSIIQHRQRRPFNIQHSNIQHSTFNIAQSATIQHSTLNIQHLKNYGN